MLNTVTPQTYSFLLSMENITLVLVYKTADLLVWILGMERVSTELFPDPTLEKMMIDYNRRYETVHNTTG